MNYYLLLILLLFKFQLGAQQGNSFKFSVSPYNLLFTTVEIEDKEYTALIDFGDFSTIQISTKLIEDLHLSTDTTGILISDINGNKFPLEKGILDEMTLGEVTYDQLPFNTAKNEIKMVSDMVGTAFDVVLGFGFFKNQNFTLNFIDYQIEMQTESLSMNKNYFTCPVNTSLGYLICSVKNTNQDDINLLFDTGTPYSMIDHKMVSNKNAQLENTQGVQTFPIALYSSNQSKTFNFERSDMSALSSLSTVGIIGVNDMIGNKFTYNSQKQELTISN
ncbi:retropepsin-like aspartic protease [Crocinitomix algicola]|uniref:retropepsin-like aspartic protease n=1 Tax=Crocinitomix algicola TaxID=1740263 RepID=UPI0008331D21|nr:retropepsin-like aspartic protease [Crocinitomix algicola]